MSQQGRFDALVAELGTLLDMPGLEADRDGFFGLTVGAAVTVCLQYGEEDEQVTLFCKVCTLPAGQRERALGVLMHANLFWQGTGGATLGLDPGDDSIVLAQRVALAGLHANTLAERIQHFADRSRAWATYLEEIDATQNPAEPLGASAGAPLPPFADSMLRA